MNDLSIKFRKFIPTIYYLFLYFNRWFYWCETDTKFYPLHIDFQNVENDLKNLNYVFFCMNQNKKSSLFCLNVKNYNMKSYM